MTANEIKVANYLFSKTKLDHSVQGETVSYTVQDASFEECAQQTGLTLEEVREAYSTLFEKGKNYEKAK